MLRRAAIALSDPAIRRVATATGWTTDRSRFLVPGGFVDAGSCHDDDPASGLPRVDLRDCNAARCLALRRLTDEELGEVWRHVVAELLEPHEARGMGAMLAAAALAPLRAFAGPTRQYPTVTRRSDLSRRGLGGATGSVLAWRVVARGGDRLSQPLSRSAI